MVCLHRVHKPRLFASPLLSSATSEKELAILTEKNLRFVSFDFFFFLIVFLFLETSVSHSTGWSQTLYVAEDDLEVLTFLLPLPPKRWDCERAPPHPAYLNDGKETQGFLRAAMELQLRTTFFS